MELTHRDCAGRRMLRRIPAEAALFLIRFYRIALTQFFPTTCRHIPSCSHYVEQAIRSRGFMAGARLGVLRIARCHPFSAGGYDPVPLEDKDLG